MEIAIQIRKHFLRWSEIAKLQGIKEAVITLLREFTGRLRYICLRIVRPDGLYQRDVLGSRMYLAIDDPGISKDLIIRGMRERFQTRMMKKILRSGMTVIDIGANIGYYALLEARTVSHTGHVYAIEPEHHNAELLNRNVNLNGYRHVHVMQAGVSDETGTAQLYVSKHRNLHNLLRPHRGVDGDDSIVDIKVYRLDDFVAEYGIEPSKINLIRMDIEGYEVKALAGMRGILRSATNLTLVIEFHPQYIDTMTEYTLESTMEMLESLGFKIKFATAENNRGGELQFRDIAIRDFLADERVSRKRVFSTFLEKNLPSESPPA